MGDLISRQAAIDTIAKLPAIHGSEGSWVNMGEAIEKLKSMPSAQPERKRGKWTKENACEFCGFQPWFERDIHTLSFCPNCGARMKEGEQDE